MVKKLDSFDHLSNAELAKKLGIRNFTSLADIEDHRIIRGLRELNKRILDEKIRKREYQIKITSSQEAYQAFWTHFTDFTVEYFKVMFLNRTQYVLAIDTLFIGGLIGTVVDPRVIMRRALELRAVDIILSHCHPSGSLNPSKADEEVTAKIKEAAKLFDIKVRDHIIVAEHYSYYYSFADEGVL